MVDDDDDRKVKDLIAAAKAGDANIDPETASDLARWFGLPSYQQVAEGEAKAVPVPEDPEVTARREAIERAMAAVDPVWCEAMHDRWAHARDLIKYEPIELRRIDPSIAVVDPSRLVVRELSEPREYEVPMGLRDDLNQCTPQAVLRDLHRSEEMFMRQHVVDESLQALTQAIDAQQLIRDQLRSKLVLEVRTTATAQVRAAREVMEKALRDPWAELDIPNRRRVRE